MDTTTKRELMTLSQLPTDPEDQLRRFRRFGFERMPDISCCPRVVAGLKCLTRGGRREPACICRRFGIHAGVLDHPRMWKDSSGRYVFTAEPYQADGHELAEFFIACNELGLDVTVSGYSPYFPGSTFLITVRRYP